MADNSKRHWLLSALAPLSAVAAIVVLAADLATPFGPYLVYAIAGSVVAALVAVVLMAVPPTRGLGRFGFSASLLVGGMSIATLVVQEMSDEGAQRGLLVATFPDAAVLQELIGDVEAAAASIESSAGRIEESNQALMERLDFVSGQLFDGFQPRELVVEPQSAEEFYNNARTHFGANNLSLAEEQLEQGLSLGRRYQDYMDLLATVMKSTYGARGAVSRFEALVPDYESDAVAATAYIELIDPELRLESAESAVARFPSHGPLLFRGAYYNSDLWLSTQTIFQQERFSQFADAYMEQEASGVILGLYIDKSIVAAMTSQLEELRQRNQVNGSIEPEVYFRLADDFIRADVRLAEVARGFEFRLSGREGWNEATEYASSPDISTYWFDIPVQQSYNFHFRYRDINDQLSPYIDLSISDLEVFSSHLAWHYGQLNENQFFQLVPDPAQGWRLRAPELMIAPCGISSVRYRIDSGSWEPWTAFPDCDRGRPLTETSERYQYFELLGTEPDTIEYQIVLHNGETFEGVGRFN